MVTELTALRADELAALEIFKGCPAEDLMPLAASLQPLQAAAGQILMQQGEQAVSFLLISSGMAEIKHVADDDVVTVEHVSAGTIVGEIALLRHIPRTATVTTTELLTGWIGDSDAFARLVHIPGIMSRLVRTVRQRLAAFLTPIPVRVRDGTELLLASGAARRQRANVAGARPVLQRNAVSAVHVGAGAQPGADGLLGRGRLCRPLRLGDDRSGRQPGCRRALRARRSRSKRRRDRVHRRRRLSGPRDRFFLIAALSVAARVDGVEKFSGRMLADNVAMRTIMDHYGAFWERDDVGVVTTVIDVPDPRDLPLSRDMADKIKRAARQVIRAVS